MAASTVTIHLKRWRYDNADRGCECAFIAHVLWLGRTQWGLKLYKTQREAEAARRRQEGAWRVGIAPGCGDTVRVHIERRKRPAWGYFTEHAIPCADGGEEEAPRRHARAPEPPRQAPPDRHGRRRRRRLEPRADARRPPGDAGFRGSVSLVLGDHSPTLGRRPGQRRPMDP